MAGTTVGFPARYRAALREHLAGGSAQSLEAAYELGRTAVAEGLAMLDLAEVHHAGLADALDSLEPMGERTIAVAAAGDFLREALATYEVVARGYQEATEMARLEHEFALQQAALADASVALNATLEPKDVVALVAQQARRVLDAARAEVSMDPGDTNGDPLRGRSVAAAGAADGEPGAHVFVPLFARDGRRLGGLSAVARRGRTFGRRDEAMLTQLAALASAAAENSRLFAQQRSISQTLQRSLLPPRIPAVPGMEVAARYSPAGEGLEVGGDFYDVFPTEGDEWALVIGDVCGKGPEAAAVTALARHTLRAVAAHEHIPSRILRRLSDAMLEQRPDGRFVSVAYARVRSVLPELANLQISLGGHPPALLRRADGTVEPTGEPGTLLGIVDAPTLADVDVRLGPGDVLVLYTDGVTDVRHAKRELFGLDDLLALVAGARDLGPAALAARIEDEVLNTSGGRPRDDVAVLTLGLAT